MKHLLSYQLFEKKKFVKPKEATPQELKKRWDKKRDSIKELQKNISKLRNKVTSDMSYLMKKQKLLLQ